MDNPWAALQADVKTRLESDAFFTGVPIITEDKGDLESEVQSALVKGGLPTDGQVKTGLAMLILTPRAAGSESNSKHLVCDTNLRLAVFECGVLNRGETGHGKPALDVLWQAARLLQGWARFEGAVPARMVSFDSDEDAEGGVLSYFADFTFRQALSTQ